MTKKWHTVEDYCSDPSGYEAHRRLSLAAAHARESSTLRAKIAELRQALEQVAQVALDALGADRTRIDCLEAQRIILKQARAALGLTADSLDRDGGGEEVIE